MTVALAQRPCKPCRGGLEPLTREQCAPYFADVPDWVLDATARRISRRFLFPDYRTALAFANAVSTLAEEVWHHPELVLGWGFCEVGLTTRKIGGLHESDFVMAARIDALSATPLQPASLPPPRGKLKAQRHSQDRTQARDRAKVVDIRDRRDRSPCPMS
jgi:4a-hydroxytetrahydrobiopterin dehydratase